MKWLDKLLGKQPPASPAPPPEKAPVSPPMSAPEPSAEAPASDSSEQEPKLIRVFDKYGRELLVPREQWRTSVLPNSIQASWNNPDSLYGLIVDSLRYGFRAEIVAAAEQLYRIDTDAARGACMWGIVLMDQNRLDEAEKVFRDFAARHGEVGVVLTNLAKVYARRNDPTQAEAILWRSLEVDPNLENAILWYAGIQRERGGEPAGEDALRRIAAVQGSWRPQLWLARAALRAGDIGSALSLYRESLARLARPIPGDVLMQVSGDLGNAGRLAELLEIVEPHFDVKEHGLQVGSNLIKAHVDLKHFDSARRVLDQLGTQNRPDWKSHLNFWDTEIAKGRIAQAPAIAPTDIESVMLRTEGPAWLRPDSPAVELFGAKSQSAAIISFIGCSAEVANSSDQIRSQLSDAPGRMSRALPFFLAEQVEMLTTARTRTLVPWVTKPHCGFVLAGEPWSDAEAARYALQGDVNSDYVVVSHLKTRSDPWTCELRLVRPSDGRCVGQLSESIAMPQLTDGVRLLANRLLQMLAQVTQLGWQAPNGAYGLPKDATFPEYLLRLEQLLTVRCAAIEGVRDDFLSGARDILDGNIHHCLESPNSVNARLILAETFLAMKRVRPDVVTEFKEPLAWLQKEHPLVDPAHSVLHKRLDDV